MTTCHQITSIALPQELADRLETHLKNREPKVKRSEFFREIIEDYLKKQE